MHFWTLCTNRKLKKEITRKFPFFQLVFAAVTCTPRVEKIEQSDRPGTATVGVCTSSAVLWAINLKVCSFIYLSFIYLYIN